MAKVTIFLKPIAMMGMMFYDKKVIPVVREHLPDYKNVCTFEHDKSGEEAAEEAFDLTNNPERQDEREQKYGRGQSLSSGDVVDVDGEKFLCMSFGWAKL